MFGRQEDKLDADDLAHATVQVFRQVPAQPVGFDINLKRAWPMAVATRMKRRRYQPPLNEQRQKAGQDRWIRLCPDRVTIRLFWISFASALHGSQLRGKGQFEQPTVPVA